MYTKTSQEVAYRFKENIIARFGLPVAIRSDNGTEFHGVFEDLCRTFNILHIFTSVAHPSANG